tara:strand:- start:1311 stop:1679 length:369 start_codon:yes stop_codon:yes gene_type:complete
MQETLAEIRNISVTGRKNRLYGGLLLILIGIIAVLEAADSATLLELTMIFGFFTAGCLVLLESTTQVCVYHGFMGTHESSSGRKKHSDNLVAAACRSKSWIIIFQSVIFGVLSIVISLWVIT